MFKLVVITESTSHGTDCFISSWTHDFTSFGRNVKCACRWTEENTGIIVELFVKQVNAGNMPSTHLTPNAYDEVGKEFLMRTGLEYSSKQVRNKWDKLKHEYNTFKKLKLRETTGGWDSEKNTVKQDNEWWKKARVDLPGCFKFKKHGLRNEEGLRILFEDISVDGSDHWNPASGQPPPSSLALKTALNVDEITDLDLEDDTEEQASPTIARASKVRLGVKIPEKNL